MFLFMSAQRAIHLSNHAKDLLMKVSIFHRRLTVRTRDFRQPSRNKDQDAKYDEYPHREQQVFHYSAKTSISVPTEGKRVTPGRK